jgi:hypothetical protein
MFARVSAVTVVAVLLAFLWLAQPAYETVAETRRLAMDTRARLIADVIANDLSRATQAGIAISALRDIGAVVELQLKGRTEFRGVQITSTSGEKAIKVPSQFDDARTLRVVSNVLSQDGTVAARVELFYEDQAEVGVLLELGALMLGLIVIGVIPAFIFLREAIQGGPQRRDSDLDVVYKSVADGKFNRLPAEQSKDHDMRAVWITRQTRTVNEENMRLTRLIRSLIATEPSPSRREALYAVSRSARAGSTFVEDSKDVTESPARSAIAWVLLFGSAGLIAIPVAGTAPLSSGLAFFFAACALGLVLAHVLFDATIRRFGCALFAIASGLTGALLPNSAAFESSLTGLAMGFVCALYLRRESRSLWLIGIAIGLGLGLTLAPLSDVVPRLTGLLLLLGSFLVSGTSHSGDDNLESSFTGKRFVLAVIVGFPLGLLLCSTNGEVGVFSGALLGLSGACGLVLGLWLRLSARVRWMLGTAALVSGFMSVSTGSTVWALPAIAAAALLYGSVVTRVLQDLRDVAPISIGACLACVAVFLTGFTTLPLLVALVVLMTFISLLKRSV